MSLYQINTNKCTHLLLKHHFINTKMYQQCSLRMALWGLKHIGVIYSANKVVLMCASVGSHLQGRKSAPIGRIFMKFGTWVFLENPSRILKFHQNPTIIMGPLHEDQHALNSSVELLPRLTGRTTTTVIKSIIEELSNIHILL